ncbi:acetyl-CoA carboxylase biotin carboxyl carrier protein subunit [Tepidibacter aestuarii]|uniref:acetyl-CoA carboxylase biotin carboxyl carrier protein subunit n=1 Tax=Tepidibacter aestuarii TaxID=2925782 RepID=UPI0020BF2A37|nr:acetyl-CoA carboxylase biotin carboxyl carrier protein subunit [Tepidibacter aestuarii]CAH2214061.1 Biotin-requiring enzyme [Tepidibacter aestuarii]
MKKYKIKLNDKVYEVEVEEVEGDKTIKESISEIQNFNQKEQSTIQEQSSVGNDCIKAPMPGKIVSLQVKEGELVKKGQVVCTLEAMKMENEIVAPINGKVSSISIDPGQNVSAGDALLFIG